MKSGENAKDKGEDLTDLWKKNSSRVKPRRNWVLATEECGCQYICDKDDDFLLVWWIKEPDEKWRNLRRYDDYIMDADYFEGGTIDPLSDNEMAMIAFEDGGFPKIPEPY